jgi:hypothetical protein
MEGISQLFSDSLARNGIRPTFDHLRLEWSRWFRCESSFSVLLAPSKPGIFALGEEIIPPASTTEELRASSPAGKRMLALFNIADTDDVGMALGRLFLPGNPLREKLEGGKCFVRYAVIEDSTERSAAFKIFQTWLQDSSETASYQDVA